MSNDKTPNNEYNEYDGIKELDNQLPNWWLILFFATLIWGFFYWFHFSLFGGKSQEQEFKEEMAKIESIQEKNQIVSNSDSKIKNLNSLVGDIKIIETGKGVFLTNCASCHGKTGGGSIGPNLTDDFWIKGKGTLEGILKVINEGSLEKGMPPWGSVLSPDKRNAVTIYIKSIIGTNPPNAKAPQGDKFPQK